MDNASFSILQICPLEQLEETILDIYIKHIKNLPDDFKAYFKDLMNMEIPEWFISPFNIEMENANLDTFLKEELIEITVNVHI